MVVPGQGGRGRSRWRTGVRRGDPRTRKGLGGAWPPVGAGEAARLDPSCAKRPSSKCCKVGMPLGAGIGCRGLATASSGGGAPRTPVAKRTRLQRLPGAARPAAELVVTGGCGGAIWFHSGCGQVCRLVLALKWRWGKSAERSFQKSLDRVSSLFFCNLSHELTSPLSFSGSSPTQLASLTSVTAPAASAAWLALGGGWQGVLKTMALFWPPLESL